MDALKRRRSCALATSGATLGWAFTLLALAAPAAAHSQHGQLLNPWLAWNADPLVIAGLGSLAAIYGLGAYRIFSRGAQSAIGPEHVSAWFAGLFFLVTALLSPIDTLGEELFWMHMIQHMIIMMVAAPLMAAGAPDFVMIWSLPLRWRRRLGGIKRKVDSWQSPWYFLWQPLLLWPLFAFTLWIWHLPRFYEATLHSYWIHAFQHISFFVTSFLFWRVLLDPISRLRLSTGMGVLYLFATSLHAMLLGVFMTLSPRVWYPTYGITAPAWNLTALEDQQLAGLIMWMPACTIYGIVASAIFLNWFQKSQAAGRLP